MAALILSVLLLLHLPIPGLAQSGAPPPLQVKASTQLYGPDGPWQAVSVEFGFPGQPLDLYPGGVWESTILTDQICQDHADVPCGTGGLFNPDESETLDDTSVHYNANVSGNTSDLGYELIYGAMLLKYTNTTPILDQLQIANRLVSNFSAKMYSSLTMVYSGVEYPVQVGELSLGPIDKQSFSDGGPTTNASLIPGFFDAEQFISSNSYGLHVGIGAEAHKLDLSLMLGGYDASRIVGNVSHQAVLPETDNDVGNEFAINLLDVAIGVDHGESPFSYSSKEGLLSSGNSSITSDGVQVVMNPLAPYLSLPNSTCAAIANELPVTYNADLSLYFWDVTDPQYTKIVTSPTYLSFVFNGSSGNLTINVPFQLLNLTLQAPLVSTNTSYFPCQPPRGNTSEYSLGRAFLQAAFIGVSWGGQGKGDWYLAQAPGPNIDPIPQPKPILDDVPESALSSNWSETWNGHWTALQVSSPTPKPPAPQGNPPKNPSHSLSGGAIAGIVVGCVCAGLIAVGIGILIIIRRRHGTAGAVQPIINEKDDGQDSSPLIPQNRRAGYRVAQEPVRVRPSLGPIWGVLGGGGESLNFSLLLASSWCCCLQERDGRSRGLS